jgi:hypothetical protein
MACISRTGWRAISKLDHPYVFLDLKNARGPMRQAQTLRVPKYDEVEIPDPARPYSGLFFIARMERGKQLAG